VPDVYFRLSSPGIVETPPQLVSKVDSKPFTTLNFTDLGSPFGGPNEDPPGTPNAMSGEAHIGPPTPHESANSTPVSKSAFIELQQHGYGPLRTSYQHHFNSPAGNAHGGPTGAHDAGFPSPRGALGAYPFPPMHQNSYTGYHLGSYATNCPPSPKDDGKLRAGRPTRSETGTDFTFYHEIWTHHRGGATNDQR
jgi:hypothetical protein